MNLTTSSMNLTTLLLLQRSPTLFALGALLVLLYACYVYNKLMNKINQLEQYIKERMEHINQSLDDKLRTKYTNPKLGYRVSIPNTQMDVVDLTMVDIDLTGYAKGVGPIYACQECLKLYINDKTNEYITRRFGQLIYEWLGTLDCTIDELLDLSLVKTKFILMALEKYKPDTTDSDLVMNYGEAVESLTYQMNQLTNTKPGR